MSIKRLATLAFAILLLTGAGAYIAFSKSTNTNSFEFKAKSMLIKIKAGAWDEKTQIEVARKNLESKGGSPDYLNALHLLNEAANAGSGEAKYLLANFYKDGKGVVRDEPKYLELLESASASGYGEATYELAHQKLQSDSEDEFSEGFSQLLFAADQKHPKAIKEVVDALIDGKIDGKTVEQDYIKALKYSKMLSDTGSNDGKFLMGMMTYYGYGTAKDENTGLGLITEAANTGNLDAKVLLGSFEYGRKDYRTALKFFEPACTKGSGSACYWAAETYLLPEHTGNDLKKAAEYAFKAADLRDSRGYLFLARLYWNGKGVNLDKNESIKWYLKAADAGLKEAQYEVALGYFQGDVDGKPNDSLAAKYFQMAADKGHVQSSGIIGSWFITGKGVNKDFGKAHAYLKFALDSGSTDPDFQTWFAYLYANGLGVTKDANVAFAWNLKAAEQNYGMAENNIAYAYATGDGVQKDTTKATNYFYFAMLHGYNDAASNLAYYYYSRGYYQDSLTWYVVSDKLGGKVPEDISGVRSRLDYNQQRFAYAAAEKWLKTITLERKKLSANDSKLSEK